MCKEQKLQKKLAEIIRSELEFTNGWAIDDNSYKLHSEKAAKRIISLMKRRKVLK